MSDKSQIFALIIKFSLQTRKDVLYHTKLLLAGVLQKVKAQK